MSVADTLLQKRLLTQDQLKQAVALQQAEGLRLDRAVIQLGFVTELQLLEVVGELLDLPLANLTDITIDSETLRSLPSKFVFRKRLIPLSMENSTLRVATSDPFDMNVFDDIRLLTGLNVRPMLAPAEEIEKVIKSHYGVGGDTVDEMVGTGETGAVHEAGESSEDLIRWLAAALVAPKRAPGRRRKPKK